MAKLRAAEKSSHQGKWWTSAPISFASSTVLSVDPVSATTTSSATDRTELMARGRLASSFRAMKHTLSTVSLQKAFSRCLVPCPRGPCFQLLAQIPAEPFQNTRNNLPCVSPRQVQRVGRDIDRRPWDRN